VSSDFHNTTSRRAAKEHRCVECRGAIPKGESYTVFTGCHESDFYSVKMCADCTPQYEEANRRAWRDNGEGLPFGSLYEDIFETHDPVKIAAHIAVKEKRGATVPDWMRKRLAERLTQNPGLTGAANVGNMTPL
jgi:hypothetical protein